MANLVQVSIADTGRFVKAHGGELRAEANPGGDTVFRFHPGRLKP
jgi:hypothetical protein